MSVESTEWVTVAKAATRLGVSASWLRSLADEGSIEIERRGGRSWMVPKWDCDISELSRFLE